MAPLLGQQIELVRRDGAGGIADVASQVTAWVKTQVASQVTAWVKAQVTSQVIARR